MNSPRPSQDSKTNPLNVSRIIRILSAIAAMALFLWVTVSFLAGNSSPSESVATYTLEQRNLVDTLVESGTLESQSKVEGVCELHGWQNKITFILEEGTTVEKGEVVVKFDSSTIETLIASKKVKVNNEQAAVNEAKEQIAVQENKNQSDIAAAKLEKTLAELDLRKYKEGDYKAEVAELDRSIAESKAALEQKREELKNLRILVKKGYREPELLVQMEQAVKSAEFQVDRDDQKKEVLTKFTYLRQITELESKAEEAGRKLSRAEATAKAELAKAKLKLAAAKERLEIETKELKEEQDQLDKAVIKAKHSGTVAYANHRWMPDDNKIRLGGSVHRRQTVFHLPDMTKMQVQLEVHESLINKLKVGQKAIVQVATFPDHKFKGHIKKIADLARSDGYNEEKAYTAIVTIEEFPDDVKLKPGMSAETEIHVRTLKKIIAIPVQAVTQIAGQEFAYVKRGDVFERVEIDVADGNESFLVLKAGLNVGDTVAMDAYQRGLADVESEGLDDLTGSESEFENVDESSDSESGKKQAKENAEQPAGEGTDTATVDDDKEEKAINEESTSKTDADKNSVKDSLEEEQPKVGKTSEEVEPPSPPK